MLMRMIKPQKRQSVKMNNHITVYGPEGEEMSVSVDKYAGFEALGWSIHKDTALYAPDGNTITVPTAEKKKWLDVGWYDYPVLTVYAPDGRSEVILQSEKEAWLAAGWYEYPVITVYAADGRSEVILRDEKDAWLGVGWYDYPVLTVYAADGRSAVILQSEKDAWLDVGWYGSPFIPLPGVLAAKGYTTDLPVISIGTGGKSISSKTDYVPCIVNTFNVESDLALNDAAGGIRIRGNSSRAANPPPYRIKLDTKANLLGLNNGAKAKSWVLLNYPDGAVESIKNDIAFRLGRYLLEPEGGYCTDARFVHLYINTGFCGTYLLCEQTQVNKHRVDVNEPENGYTGTDVGYLVEIDNYSEPPYFRVDYEKAYASDISQKSRTFRSASYSIKSDVYSQEQKDFIANYVRGVFKIIYYACEENVYLKFDENYNVVYAEFGDAWETVANVIDIDSFVDMYILYELMHDNDVGEGSFFMCVDFSEGSKHKKLTLTAPWDFNWTCFGSATGQLYASTFCTDSFMRTYGDRSNPWFIVLYKQWWFRELVRTKWTEAGGSAGIDGCINEETQMLDKYRADINRRMDSAVERGKVYLNWIHNRAVWLDSLWLK